MELSSIFGWVASISMVLGYVPQTIQTVRTRRTDDIATGTFLLMGLGALCFAIQGWLTGNWPLLTCNVLTTAMSAIIFGIKIYNDHFKRPTDPPQKCNIGDGSF